MEILFDPGTVGLRLVLPTRRLASTLPRNMARRLPLLLLLVLIAAPHRPARGATAWVETGAVIDTVVADTATLAPANPLVPLAAPVPFQEFRYPHVDDAENVTFIADDPVYGPEHGQHGVFRSFAADGHLQTLVSQDDLVPGTDGKFSLIRGLQPDEHGVDLVFNASGDSHVGEGFYLWSGGKVTTVARRGTTVLPGDTAPLSMVAWGALHAGRILYVADDAAERPVLVLHDVKTGADRVLLRDGNPVPGHPGEAFHYLAHQDWLGASSVILRAGTMDHAAADPIGKRKPGRSGLYGWFNVRWEDPATLDPARLVTLADTDTPMPGFDGERFTDFRSAPVQDGLVGFEASGDRGKGIYFSRDGGPVRPIVDSETELPGLFRGKFRDFGIWTAVVKNGVVFTAHAAGFTGVFLYRTEQDMLYLLADNRAPLEGKHISDFEIGSRPLVGNRFAVTAHFAGGGSGVYLATVPAHAFRRQ